MQVMAKVETVAAFAAPGSAVAPAAPVRSFARLRLSILHSHMEFPPETARQYLAIISQALGPKKIKGRSSVSALRPSLASLKGERAGAGVAFRGETKATQQR